MSEYLHKGDWVLPGEQASQGLYPLPMSACFSSYPCPPLGIGASISVSTRVCECVGGGELDSELYYIPISSDIHVPTDRGRTRGLAGGWGEAVKCEGTKGRRTGLDPLSSQPVAEPGGWTGAPGAGMQPVAGSPPGLTSN